MENIMTPEQIRKLRGDLTQAVFARKIGLSVQQVSNLETGRNKPSRITLMKLLKYQGKKS
jgi:DNA-binding transcriptional regulator YiaG